MSGHPPPGHRHDYGRDPLPPQPYYSSNGGAAPAYKSPSPTAPYGAPPSAPPPPGDNYGSLPSSGYGGLPPISTGSSRYGGFGVPPPASSGSSGYGGYGDHPPPSSGSSGYGGYVDRPPPSSDLSGYGSYGDRPPTSSESSGYGGYGDRPPPSYGSSGYGGYGAPPPQGPYGSPFASLVPSAFPPGTDPNVVACFQMGDRDGSGSMDDKGLQWALTSYNHSFSLRTVHLLMYLFTNSNARKIGPNEFASLFYNLQSWRDIFERFDKDRSGKIDVNELRDALLSLGFSVSPRVLDLMVSKSYKSGGGKNKMMEYDDFIECCLIVKGLTEKFKGKDTTYTGSATFTYEDFMLIVLPFLLT